MTDPDERPRNPDGPGSPTHEPVAAAADHDPADAPTVQHPAADAPEAAAHTEPVAPAAPAQAPAGSGGFRRFVGYRATQLVAVGLLGALLGGGVVATVGALGHPDGPSRTGYAGQQGPRGGDGGFRHPGQLPPGFGGPGSNRGPGT
ncbi:hypothetical protein [Pseudonocardia sp. GCM10023141]|uniref:hypothetical protein n=1 Tax=Pseudonocardia sp. GCM10023141 TaxID=3252653 RepID=UPI003608BAE9